MSSTAVKSAIRMTAKLLSYLWFNNRDSGDFARYYFWPSDFHNEPFDREALRNKKILVEIRILDDD